MSQWIVAGIVHFFIIAAATAEDAMAAHALDRASAHLAAQNAIHVDIEMAYDVEAEGRKDSMTTQYSLTFSRPHNLRVRMDGGDAIVEFVSDGANFTTYITEYDAYTVQSTTRAADDVVFKSGFGPYAAVTSVAAEFIKEKPFADLRASARSISHEGVETIGGAKCDRVRISREKDGWDLWIANGEPPLIHQIKPDMSGMIESIRKRGVRAEAKVDATLKNWSFATLSGDSFTFVPPAGAEQVASFGQKQAARTKPEGLLGLTAPDFQIPLLGGGTLDLASKLGNEVVILDFWATWCGPCRTAMPVMAKVTNDFADRGVRLYAVNLQEDAAKIQPFLDSTKLDLAVALDSDGKVAQQYRVSAIPMTFVIGKDGRVQAIHRGYHEGLEAKLTSELEALVAGKSLVE